VFLLVVKNRVLWVPLYSRGRQIFLYADRAPLLPAPSCFKKKDIANGSMKKKLDKLLMVTYNVTKIDEGIYPMSKILTNLGKKITQLRQQKGLNQESLAVRTGLSRSYITLMESGKKIPTISTLSLIADCLGVEIREFFSSDEDEADHNVVIVKKKDRETLMRTSLGYVYTGLAVKKKWKIMEPFLIKIPPGIKRSGKFVHISEEFMFILEGILEFTCNGKPTLLEEGDSVYFDSALPHSLEVVGNKPATFLSVHGRLPPRDFRSFPVMNHEPNCL